MLAAQVVLSRVAEEEQRHRHLEYLDFLLQIGHNVPPGFDVHLIVDNYATLKHPREKRWLATRLRFHVPLHSDLRLLARSLRSRTRTRIAGSN
jgi:hypothetical protein